MLTAFLPQQLHQLFTVGAVDNVLITVGVDIAFFQSGKVSVKLLVKVFAVAVAQRQPHTETNNAVNAGFDTVI